jgi:hypothetical protein
LAAAIRFQRGIADRLIGFTRIALGAHFLTDVLAAILPSFLELSGSRFVICHEANAATHGFNCWRAPYQRTCSGGRGIGRNYRAESPEVIAPFGNFRLLREI